MADILECKYLWGEIIGMLPLTGLWSAVQGLLKSVLTNPVGLVKSAITLGCSISMCAVSSKGTEFCDYAGNFLQAVDVIENIIGMIDQYPTMNQDYCSQVGEGGWI